MLGMCERPFGVDERNGAGFHGDATLLFVLSAVHITKLSGHSGRNDAIGREQSICQSGLT